MEWVKLSSKGILRGSLSQTTDVVQLVWIKLLCLMSETKFRNGRFEYTEGKPYPLDFIATNCGVTKGILEGCLCEYEEDVNPEDGSPRIKFDDDGTLILVNWEKYQRKPEKVIAKEIAIAYARQNKQTKRDDVQAFTRAVNEFNSQLGRIRYTIDKSGNILDTVTGQLVSIEQIKDIEGDNDGRQ